MNEYLDKLDEQWHRLSLKQQRRYTFYFFIGYLLLTIMMIVKVSIDTTAPNEKKELRIEHIENPVLEQKKNPTPLPDRDSITSAPAGK